MVFDPKSHPTEGNLIVSNTSNNEILWYNHQAGELTGAIEKLPGMPKLEHQTSICIQPHTNNLVVCNTWKNSVEIIAMEGEGAATTRKGRGRPNKALCWDAKKMRYLFSIGGTNPDNSFDLPQGVCCDAAGRVYVSDCFNHAIKSFDPSGKPLSAFGQIWQGDLPSHPESLFFVHPRFSPSSSASSLLGVMDSNNSRVSLWAIGNSGAMEHAFNLRVNSVARNACVDLNGYLNVLSAYPNHEVSVFDLRVIGSNDTSNSRALVARFTTPFKALEGVCVDDTNNFIIGIDTSVVFFEPPSL